jgi:hypothetical protein
MGILANHRVIDAAFIGVFGLIAVSSVIFSAIGGERIMVVLSGMLLSAAAIIVSSLMITYIRFTRRRIMPALIAPLCCLVILVSVAVTHWPMRVGYALSRDAFDVIAEHVRAGEQITTPKRVGPFIIRRVAISENGIVCLWTYPRPGGSAGFVQCRRDYVPFNLWSHVALDDHWQFIGED